MKFFSKNEVIGIAVVLLAVALASWGNFKLSLRRARDVQRKNDIRLVADSLLRYSEDFGAFPLSEGGKIVACKGPETKIDSRGIIRNLVPCEWGKDALADVFDPAYPPYVSTLPLDPQSPQGGYLYFSSGRRFQLFAALEGSDEAEYDQAVVKRGLLCGGRICNFGLGYGGAPLDKSIEEYENELLGK